MKILRIFFIYLIFLLFYFFCRMDFESHKIASIRISFYETPYSYFVKKQKNLLVPKIYECCAITEEAILRASINGSTKELTGIWSFPDRTFL